MKHMQPDFLQIPKIVHRNKNLRPTDWIVFASIYWYEHMKEGKCFASNSTLASVAEVSERAVMGSLDRLEKEGYIARTYQDEKRTRRAEIKCLVSYGINAKKDMQTNQKALPGMPKTKIETPGEFARRFFSGQHSARFEVCEQIMLHSHGKVPQEAVAREINKFVAYWTEPNKSGTKMRWELQQTFDVTRRLYTWLSRAGVRAGSRAGAGITV